MRDRRCLAIGTDAAFFTCRIEVETWRAEMVNSGSPYRYLPLSAYIPVVVCLASSEIVTVLVTWEMCM